MKLNRIERLIVNSPLRRMMQSLEIRWFTKKHLITAGGRILEIGCGRGVGAAYILEKFSPQRLSLLDLDIQMVRKARIYLKNRQETDFCVADAVFLPFENDAFDAVFGFGFLHHVPKWRNSLAEVGRVLKKNGAYFMVEIYPALYQNVIAKRLLVHPESDRFYSPDLMDALKRVNLTLTHAFELKNLGIIGIGIKL